MSTSAMVPDWMHLPVTAHEYDSWPAERCDGIEIVDGMVVMTPSGSKRHNRVARVLANALDPAGGSEWNADIDFDVRLHDVPLTNRRPDVVVYRASTIDVTPTRPADVLLVAEVVSPGSETTDRLVKANQYAQAAIPFYWRVELEAAAGPTLHTYVLDPAQTAYVEAEVFVGTAAPRAPFPIVVDFVQL